MKKSELRQIIKNIINEEFLGNIVAQNYYSINNDYQTVEVYKNPKHIKNFPLYVRGWITEGGDLYMIDTPLLIHKDIKMLLKKRLNVKNVNVAVMKTNKEELEFLDFKGRFNIDKFKKKNPNISIK